MPQALDYPLLFRAFSTSKLLQLVLGRCLRLLHFAPLALGSRDSIQTLSCWAIISRPLRGQITVAAQSACSAYPRRWRR
jgi:hypothetical protein